MAVNFTGATHLTVDNAIAICISTFVHIVGRPVMFKALVGRYDALMVHTSGCMTTKLMVKSAGGPW